MVLFTEPQRRAAAGLTPTYFFRHSPSRPFHNGIAAVHSVLTTQAELIKPFSVEDTPNL